MKFIILLLNFLIFSYGHQQIRMTDITALTFNQGEYSTARRGQPVPQLKCVSGTAKNDYSLHPTSVQCVNVGNDGRNVQWKCDANLDSKVKFGKMVVSCEGYSQPGDPYVLVGSCGLEYALDYDKGAEASSSYSAPRYSSYDHSEYEYDSSGASSFFNIVFFFVVVAVAYYCLTYFAGHNRIYDGYASSAYGNPSYGANPGYGAGYGPTYNAGYSSWWPGSSYGSGSGWWNGFATGGLLSSMWNSSYRRPTYGSYGRSFGGSSLFGGSSFGSGRSSGGSRRSTGFASSTTR